MKQEARNKCRSEGKRPLTVFRETINTIPRIYPNEVEQHEMEIAMPAYKKIRRSLYRHVNHAVLPIPDENVLPIPYTVTLREREVINNDHNANVANERFLLFQNDAMLVFMAASDIQVMHNSEFIIADGTFEMVPRQFYQLYTLHGFKNAVTVCHALLRNKQRETYVQLFTVIRDVLVHTFGNIGSLHTILMDFEGAAHDAARAVFLVQTLGCTFHFGQCLQRWIQQHGLKGLYENNVSGTNEWIKLIRAMVLLPPDLAPVAWHQWLCNPPHVENQIHQQQLTNFVQYFENAWIYGMHPVQVWNHFRNVWLHDPVRRGFPGPRTTNHAEGWHSKLNHDFGRPHPSLSSFLHWLQCSHHMTQVRVAQLANGAEPQQRDPRYQRVDEQIFNVKETFLHRRSNVAGNLMVVVGEVNDYLRHVSHLLG